jgi:hypothetical protein
MVSAATFPTPLLKEIESLVSRFVPRPPSAGFQNELRAPAHSYDSVFYPVDFKAKYVIVSIGLKLLL